MIFIAYKIPFHLLYLFNFQQYQFKKMKPGLSVLPMDVWADVFVFNNRQQLAQIVDQFKERAFAEKLQKFLHDPKCGKHSLRFLKIYCNYRKNLKREIKPQRRATLAVASRGNYGLYYQCSMYEDCEFPETEMPENINNFRQLVVRLFDEQVLGFLNKIKPLFTNVVIDLESTQSANNLRVLFTHLLPLLGDNIRGIRCKHGCIEFFKQHFPGALAAAKELKLSEIANKACIPAYLDWLSTPLDFNVHGPRFLKMRANSRTIIAMVKAVREHFLDATTPSTFVIFLEFYQRNEQENHAEELTIQNAATKEQLVVRNVCFNTTWGFDVIYVEIVRHPIGAAAQMREWIEQRAYYENKYKNALYFDEEPEQMVSIDGYSLTVGQITKRAGAMNQDNDQPEDEDDKDEAGPSTSAKKMKK